MLDSTLHAVLIAAIVAVIGSFSAMAESGSPTSARATQSAVQLPKVVVAVKRAQAPQRIGAPGS